MIPNNIDISQILVDGDYVAAEEMQKAQKSAKDERLSLADYLLDTGMITKDLLGQAIAEHFGVAYADLNSDPPERETVLKIPEDIAYKHKAVLFKEGKEENVIATDNPGQPDLQASLATLFPLKKIKIAYSLTGDIESVFIHYRKTLETRFSGILAKKGKIAPEIIDEIIQDALLYRASDIHFEPQDKDVVIRFRIDGVLHEAGRIAKEYYPNILNRVKVQAQLRIDEHFSAQDGAIRFSKDNKTTDMRVSVMPTVNGEKIVIRVLSEYVRSFNLGELGLSLRDQKTINHASRKPFGMILVSGPTGSGKTTTLYALLQMVNRPEVNITTIEDPVEYKITGINQIQVNAQTNITFAKGLRAIVRQDPDIVLVGEIRDKETAEIAVNAALTGHLLLSTIHGNDAATGIIRLLDMGVEPFLLSSTLEIVASQRLVRKICESCRYTYHAKRSDLAKAIPDIDQFFNQEDITLYKGKGCKACGNTGYISRTCIFEIITISPEMQDLILKNPSGKQIWELAQKQGAKSLFEDGMEKVKNGITTIEELLRVSSPKE